MQGHAGPLLTAIRWIEPERHELGGRHSDAGEESVLSGNRWR